MQESKQINSCQNIAIHHDSGPMLVLAGPGSGKTFVISQRIARLIREKNNPAGILVITFTKAAALEMKRRAIEILPESGAAVFGTFHSVFYQIIRNHSSYSSYQLISPYEQSNIIRQILYHLEYDSKSSENLTHSLLKEISYIKNTGKAPEEYRKDMVDDLPLHEIYQLYNRELEQAGKLDFDDMLLKCFQLLNNNQKELQKWQSKFRFILVDEFQDVNYLQYETLKLLAGNKCNIFVVGDDDQAIYGFRGSDPGYMKLFLQDFPGAKKVVLDVNYRCTRAITDFSQQCISYNRQRFSKTVFSANPEKEGVWIHYPKDKQSQMDQILGIIAQSGKEYGECAILCRTNTPFSYITEKLYENKIPYFVREKETNFYEHFMVRDMLSYLRMAVGDRKRQTFLQVMNKPLRYISRAEVKEAFVDLKKLSEIYTGNPQVRKELVRLQKDIQFLSELDSYGAVMYIYKTMGYEQYVRKCTEGSQEKREEYEDIWDLLKKRAKEFPYIPDWLTFADDYSRHFNENAEKKKDNSGNAVSLYTYHGAKGLEFIKVLLPDLNVGVVPHRKAVTDSEVEEERRMFYVAITRAREQLHCFSIKEVENQNGSISPFLRDILPSCRNTDYSSSSTISSNSELSRYSSNASATDSYSSSSSMQMSSGSSSSLSGFSLYP